MREPTVVASAPRAFVDFAVRHGADRETLLRRAGIDATDLVDVTNRIPIARYAVLMDAGVELTGDPALALEFGEQVPLEDLSMVPLIVTNARGFDDARAKMNRYSPLMVDDPEMGSADVTEFVHRDGKLFIKLTSALYARYPRLTESAIARSVCGLRNLLRTFNPELRFPESIHFTYPEPAHRKEYDRVFGAPLVFSSDMTAIGVDPAILSMAMPGSYRAAVDAVTEKAEQQLARLADRGAMRARVDEELVKTLASGEVRMEAIARQLGMSRATLSRRLKAEDSTYEEVLEAVRRRRAMELLNDEKKSVRQTAHLLGFSDPAAFSRAFKRWTGMSPKEVHRAPIRGPTP